MTPPTAPPEISVLDKQTLFQAAERHKHIATQLRAPGAKLKVFQDLAAYSAILEFTQAHPKTPLRIADVGGDQSRLIPMLQQLNMSLDCAIIDSWSESIGNGTTQKPDSLEDVALIDCLVGSPECAAAVPDNSFDIVTSISVVEHVPTSDLTGFFQDCARICAPGGMVLHLVDIHLSAASKSGRGQAYIDSFSSVFGLETKAPATWAFQPHYISNPDNMMFRWGQRSNNLAYRAERQAVTLVMRADIPPRDTTHITRTPA